MYDVLRFTLQTVRHTTPESPQKQAFHAGRKHSLCLAGQKQVRRRQGRCTAAPQHYSRHLRVYFSPT